MKKWGQYKSQYFRFFNCEEVYYEGGTIQSDHTGAEVKYAPKGFNRGENVFTSMRTAISATGCEKVEIKNAEFIGLESAVLLITPENLESDLRNGYVTINNITVTETAQPIFVSDTHNVSIKDVTMTSRASMSGGDHFIYCSRYVDNAYIGGNSTFTYSDIHYGCAINLRNAHENTASLKYCRIDGVQVSNLYRQFVSANAHTKVICNNCKITTMEDVNKPNAPYVFFVQEKASIDIINCTVEDKINQYYLTSLYDDVHVDICWGNFIGLHRVGELNSSSGNERNSIMLNVSNAKIYTNDCIICAENSTTAYFCSNFSNCDLFTDANYFFQSKVESCKIICSNCEFNHYSTSTVDNRVPVAYLDKGDGSIPLLNNIKVINCKGYGTKGIAHFNDEGDSVAYGNVFSFVEDGVTKLNSMCVPKNSIKLSMLSPELQAVIAPLLTTS